MYSVNFRRFVNGLLPFALRGNVKELACVLSQPFRALHHRFTEYRQKCLWKLSYNACVGSMQAMLNDRFADELAVNAPGRIIMIEDGDAVPAVLVYPEAEHQPVMVGTVMLTSHATLGAVPFLVKIPEELEDNTDLYYAVEALVRQYRLLGTKYRIVYY